MAMAMHFVSTSTFGTLCRNKPMQLYRDVKYVSIRLMDEFLKEHKFFYQTRLRVRNGANPRDAYLSTSPPCRLDRSSLSIQLISRVEDVLGGMLSTISALKEVKLPSIFIRTKIINNLTYKKHIIQISNSLHIRIQGLPK
jgi:hypothetical protein